MKNPLLVASSLSLSSILTFSSDNNHISNEENKKEPEFDVKKSKIKNKESSNKYVDINVTNIAYYPHNDTLIATYNCVLKGNDESLGWAQTKEISHYSTCTFERKKVSFYSLQILGKMLIYDIYIISN